MENNKGNKYKEPKNIAYDYLFNYFGKEKFKGKIITGACIQLAIRAYKDGKEVKFTEEPKYEDAYFYQVYNVSFDRKKLFNIQKNLEMDILFCTFFGWDKIESEVVGYALDYSYVFSDEEMKGMPDQFKILPCSSSMEVLETEFRDFLSNHVDDFDISDNKNAQVPSTSYLQMQQNSCQSNEL